MGDVAPKTKKQTITKNILRCTVSKTSKLPISVIILLGNNYCFLRGSNEADFSAKKIQQCKGSITVENFTLNIVHVYVLVPSTRIRSDA